MRVAELLLQDFDTEIMGARRTLERIPEPKPEFKPHEKSMAMGRLAMHVAYLPKFGHFILTTPGVDMAVTKLPIPSLVFNGREPMLDALDESAKELREALTSATDEELAAPWRFSFGEHLISEAPRSLTYRTMFFNHMIHHRAQLGVHLRMNEVAVPGLYGPSADEPFSA